MHSTRCRHRRDISPPVYKAQLQFHILYCAENTAHCHDRKRALGQVRWVSSEYLPSALGETFNDSIYTNMTRVATK